MNYKFKLVDKNLKIQSIDDKTKIEQKKPKKVDIGKTSF